VILNLGRFRVRRAHENSIRESRPIEGFPAFQGHPARRGRRGGPLVSSAPMTPAETLRRTVLHVDMDAFYASIEQLDRPELRGRPVLVGGDRPRGVVCAASYEARKFGCRSAQPMAVARRMCPHAVVVPPRFPRYHAASEAMFAILHGVSPLVEPLSIDEAFVDLTGTERLLGPAEEVARGIRARIRAELGVTASVGVAPNKFLAKIASDLRKPDGLVVVPPERVHEVLDPLPIERMWGVGAATAPRFHALGVRTIGQLRAWTEERLAREFGAAAAEHFARLARGDDDRDVVPDAQAKSLGHEQTFEVDVEEPAEVRDVLLAQADAVGRRVRRHALLARGVTVKIRYGDFETITRSATLEEATDLSSAFRAAAADLFDRWAEKSFRPVRLIGVTATRLSEGGAQLPLFGAADAERRRRLDRTLDSLKDRFGGDSIRRGRPGRE
jgi:DNA polymerase-4